MTDGRKASPGSYDRLMAGIELATGSRPSGNLDLARALGVYDPSLTNPSARVSNWSSRGVSWLGAKAAQQILGVSIPWVWDGEGPPLLQGARSQSVKLDLDTVIYALGTARATAESEGGPASVRHYAELFRDAYEAAINDRNSGPANGFFGGLGAGEDA